MNKRPGSLHCLLFLTLLLACGHVASAASDEAGNRVLLILDASGSMWGQIDGKAKIVAAKEVMSDLIKEMPATLQVGLTVYGHRQKDDCNDVEEVVPLSPINRDKLISTVRAIQPKGKTPISHSISLTAEKLKEVGGGTIILVSDGEETCGGEPCKLVADLKKSGIEFILHVVGFGVKGAVSEQLACIAKAGGGTYTEAGNAAKLKTALTGALEKTLQENLVVRAVRPAKDKKGKPAALHAVVTVSKDGARVAENSGIKVGFKLQPGTYDLAVTIPALQQSKTIEKVTVTDKTKTEKEVPFTVSALAAVAKDSTGKVIEVFLRIFAKGEETPVAEGWTGTETAQLFTLTPGTYKMELIEKATGQKSVIDDIALAEGQEVVKEVSFAMAKLAVNAKDSNGKPMSVFVEVAKSGDADKTVIASAWTSPTEPSFFELPPATYDLKVREESSGQQLDIKDVALAAGARVVKEVSFATAKIAVSAKESNGNPVSVYVEIFTAGDAERTPVASGWVYPGEPEFKELPPGTYDLKISEKGSGQEQEIKNVVLDAGARVVKEVSF